MTTKQPTTKDVARKLLASIAQETGRLYLSGRKAEAAKLAMRARLANAANKRTAR